MTMRRADCSGTILEDFGVTSVYRTIDSCCLLRVSIVKQRSPQWYLGLEDNSAEIWGSTVNLIIYITLWLLLRTIYHTLQHSLNCIWHCGQIHKLDISVTVTSLKLLVKSATNVHEMSLKIHREHLIYRLAYVKIYSRRYIVTKVRRSIMRR